MNSYLWIHRIKGPAMLVVFGITALLDEWDIISYHRSWPLYLIVLGVLQLAERAAWSQLQADQQAQPYGAVPGQYPGQVPGQYQGQYPGQYTGQYPGQYTGAAPAAPSPSTSLTVTPHDNEGR
jgi:Domain of unknown function (DUF5668)